VATFGKPSPFEIDLGGGSLTAEYNIDVPAGPKGFKPPISLIYNSAGVTGQHNPQGAAGWVGEGWNMTLGEISWAEHNTVGNGTPPCFRVFLLSGVMEEFGCTLDSVQSYLEPTGPNAGKNYLANWLLDLITEPDGNQIHITYQQDWTVNTVRDEVMSTVEW